MNTMMKILIESHKAKRAAFTGADELSLWQDVPFSIFFICIGMTDLGRSILMRAL